MDFKEEAAMLRSERAARVEAERAAAQEILRDQFAMAAMTGLCARSDFYLSGPERLDCVSVVAFAVADAMLAARGGK